MLRKDLSKFIECFYDEIMLCKRFTVQCPDSLSIHIGNYCGRCKEAIEDVGLRYKVTKVVADEIRAMLKVVNRHDIVGEVIIHLPTKTEQYFSFKITFHYIKNKRMQKTLCLVSQLGKLVNPE